MLNIKISSSCTYKEKKRIFDRLAPSFIFESFEEEFLNFPIWRAPDRTVQKKYKFELMLPFLLFWNLFYTRASYLTSLLLGRIWQNLPKPWELARIVEINKSVKSSGKGNLTSTDLISKGPWTFGKPQRKEWTNPCGCIIQSTTHCSRDSHASRNIPNKIWQITSDK